MNLAFRFVLSSHSKVHTLPLEVEGAVMARWEEQITVAETNSQKQQGK